MSYLGLDVGTSGCKAVVFDADGIQLAESYREYATQMPHAGWAELDSREVLDACMAVLAASAAACARTDPVCSIGISSQGEAFTAIGADGGFLTNGMVSFDTRAAGLALSWSREYGRDRLYRATGHTAHPMFTLFKLLWVRDHQPDVWKRARHFYCFEELVQQRLGIEPAAISYPLAARTMLFNINTHSWDPEILDAIGLDEAKLARPLPSGTVVGTVSRRCAREIGLEDNVILVTGGHDQPCGALGAGVLSAGQAVYGMGTVDCICPAFNQRVLSKELFENNLCTYDYTARNMYTTVAFSLTGGNLLRWFRDQWAADEVREAARQGVSPYQVILDNMPENPTALMVLPHFTPTGTPSFDPQATGAVLGLRLGTTRGEVLRALLEGVALEMKLNLTILERAGCRITRFTAIGGGARNPRLLQLKADVLNRPITTVTVTEAGCLGCAMLGRQALAEEALEDIAKRWVHPVEILEPDPAKAAAYEGKFETYRKLYPALKALRS